MALRPWIGGSEDSCFYDQLEYVKKEKGTMMRRRACRIVVPWLRAGLSGRWRELILTDRDVMIMVVRKRRNVLLVVVSSLPRQLATCQFMRTVFDSVAWRPWLGGSKDSCYDQIEYVKKEKGTMMRRKTCREAT